MCQVDQKQPLLSITVFFSFIQKLDLVKYSIPPSHMLRCSVVQGLPLGLKRQECLKLDAFVHVHKKYKTKVGDVHVHKKQKKKVGNRCYINL